MDIGSTGERNGETDGGGEMYAKIFVPAFNPHPLGERKETRGRKERVRYEIQVLR